MSVTKRCCVLLVLLVTALFLSGCNTLKGAVNGMKEDWKAAKKIDDWMRKNLW